MQCVDACLAIEASATNGGAPPASDELAPPAAPASGAPASIGATAPPACPEPPFPCERLCWELDARYGRGRPTTLTSLDTADDTDLAAIGDRLVRCALDRAAECRALALSGGAVQERVSWTSAFLECAGLPEELGLLD